MKPNTDSEKQAHELAMEAAMQIIHGNLFPKDIPLPTCEAVAAIIERETDLAWLCSIRRQSELVPSQTHYSGLLAVAEAAKALTVWGEADEHLYADEITLRQALSTLATLQKETE